MLNCYLDVQTCSDAVAINFITPEALNGWLNNQPEAIKHWVTATDFTAKPETFCLIPGADHKLKQVIVGCTTLDELWNAGALPTQLPPGNYCLGSHLEPAIQARAMLVWGLGSYQFSRYKKPSKLLPKLVTPPIAQAEEIKSTVSSIYLVRDLINTPTEHMGPVELAAAAKKLATQFGAQFNQIIGDELIKQNYPAIHAVGRASNQAPRLLDIQWGKTTDPKITLVGKGVCFDTGGLDIKSDTGMLLMKKDMGGAAHALGLAQMIMTAKLAINLRVLIPAVENSISANAYRPGDIIVSRLGLSIEIGNTDAEGRVILADALAEAAADKPDLIIDFATLTGAAKIALGTDLPAMFTDNEILAQELITTASQTQDPLWRLPLYKPYRKMLDSPIADINNTSSSGYGGAITAALFLQDFVSKSVSWVHFDLMAWNLVTRPGKPQGGEAVVIRTVFRYLSKKYGVS